MFFASIEAESAVLAKPMFRCHKVNIYRIPLQTHLSRSKLKASSAIWALLWFDFVFQRQQSRTSDAGDGRSVSDLMTKRLAASSLL